MNKEQNQDRIFSKQEIKNLLNDIIALANFLNNEYQRQNVNEFSLTRFSEFDVDPVSPGRNALIWRGNDNALSVFYKLTVLDDVRIFQVYDEIEFRGMFNDAIPNSRIRISSRCLSDAIYLFKELSAAHIKIVAVTNYWQAFMPLLFETEVGPVKYGTVKSRASLSPCVRSEKRRQALDEIVKKVILANKY